jgi:hypothetical protein
VYYGVIVPTEKKKIKSKKGKYHVLWSTGDEGDMGICFDYCTFADVQKWKQHTIHDVHRVQQKILLGLSNCDVEDLKIAVIDAVSVWLMC